MFLIVSSSHIFITYLYLFTVLCMNFYLLHYFNSYLCFCLFSYLLYKLSPYLKIFFLFLFEIFWTEFQNVSYTALTFIDETIESWCPKHTADTYAKSWNWVLVKVWKNRQSPWATANFHQNPIQQVRDNGINSLFQFN